MNILTAEEFLKQEGWYNEECSVNYLMTEFAKMYVEAALTVASKMATCSEYWGDSIVEPQLVVNKDSILTAYPLENIK